jgi:hypothetical protein
MFVNLGLRVLGLSLLAAPLALAQQGATPVASAHQNTAPAVLAQQDYIGRFDVYAGFADLESSALGLNQSGYHIQVGMNPRPWYSVGFDYTNANGSMVLTPNELPTALQQLVAGEIGALEAEGALPANYALRVNTDASLQSYAMGPQFNYRHFRRVTPFTHPSLGAFREQAWPHGTDPFAVAVVSNLTGGSFTKTDWTGFYGFAGGADIAITRHFGLRAQADFVWQHPFNDIMANGFWTERYSFGPSYHFGRNILNPRKPK